jgi:hypothetical protein
VPSYKSFEDVETLYTVLQVSMGALAMHLPTSFDIEHWSAFESGTGAKVQSDLAKIDIRLEETKHAAITYVPAPSSGWDPVKFKEAVKAYTASKDSIDRISKQFLSKLKPLEQWASQSQTNRAETTMAVADSVRNAAALVKTCLSRISTCADTMNAIITHASDMFIEKE